MAKVWELVQDEFESYFKLKGKVCFIYRFTDAKDLSTNKRVKVVTDPRPADFLVTLNGKTFFAEVKSTIDCETFSLSNIRDSQRVAAARQTAAGGEYFFFIKNGLGVWYRIPYSYIKAMETKTIHFKNLGDYKWEK